MYGNKIGESRYTNRTGAISDVQQAPGGNTVLRVGHILHGTTEFLQTEHLVLTPAERESLIRDLIAQREESFKPLVVLSGNPADGFTVWLDDDAQPWFDGAHAVESAERAEFQHEWWVVPARTVAPDDGMPQAD